MIAYSLFSFLHLFFTVTDTAFTTYEQKIEGTEVSFTMIPVTGGEFVMGSNASETGRHADEGPAKTVSVASFWMEAT